MDMTVFIIQTQKTEDTNYFEGTAWSRKPVTFFQAAKGISNNSGSVWRSRQAGSLQMYPGGVELEKDS